MHTHLFPPLTTFFFIIMAITLIKFPPPLHAIDDALYLECSAPFACSSFLNLQGYPFWGSNRPEYCGHPGFELNCSGDAPQLYITDRYYRVLEINYSSRILKVVRADYWNTICPDSYANSTINFALFSFTPDTTNVELYYECGSMYIIPVQPDSFQFTCTRNGNSFTNYYKRSNEDCVYNNVEVPVMQSAVSGNLSTQAALSEAIDGGFTLGWNANDSRCDGCEVSGGQCGFNTSTNAFVCHCKRLVNL
ncbi:LEAF RUST 10 DISEASE-RESISTANCE LOCUS RECEPTOR-LIKE PROTEIN KINASE-like 2.1 [Carya illinoinensis]|uniref:LEAF RUST 10 DISEASE-RESISTANCE LOCUS RECEPTOR-LIKE PROTEIN KINASE-like 2.1 n=1 Tax=Carya illinoinensis TaxID=32201 RepID=UPI001C71D3F7|nr:LEAF RUST 10 DISEASE-RESISTANCE LOCUS RECEPTOR-LIKE PROTEIN KINASE-like 2.1 [Carya illinoinensis]